MEEVGSDQMKGGFRNYNLKAASTTRSTATTSTTITLTTKTSITITTTTSTTTTTTKTSTTTFYLSTYIYGDKEKFCIIGFS